jgi:hypothetical protein
MDDLLKEAIADAKAVRETALENAKMALEEAFTPRLQNMLSQKIQTEMEDEDEEDMDEISYKEDDEDPSDEDSQEEMAMKDADEDPSDEASEEEPEVDESNIIEIDGVKYAPVVSEEDDEEMEDESEDEMDEDADLDLEAVIKELESELDETAEKDDKEEVEEQSTSSGIGKGTGVKLASSSDEEDPQGAKLKEMKDKDEDEVDEDIDLDEVLKALSEEEEEDEEKNEVAKLQSDLDEHRSVIETLRGKLNEVNLLNAKLLFTNKLFRKHGLNNEQKMKVVEQFDRASNLREVKLVYSTLGESFGARKNEINESKGSASKPIASTKSEKEVITESSDLRDRFKKLANLI